MDIKGYKELTNNASVEVREAVGRSLDAEIEAFMVGKLPYVDFHVTESQYEGFVKLLGLKEINGSAIQGIHVYNHATGYTVRGDSIKHAAYEGLWPHDALIESMADLQGLWADDPNNFEVTFAVSLDEEAIAVLGTRQYEQLSVCEDCQTAEQSDELMKQNNEGFGCGHVPETYSRDHWVGLMRTSEFPQRASWRHWDLHPFEQIPEPITIEKLEGNTLNLEQLEQGDSFRFVTHGRVSQYSSSDPETFVYDAVVIEPGTQPLCSLILTTSDGAVSAPADFYVTGSGGETTRNQNPVQQSLLAFTNNWGYLQVGAHVLLRPTKEYRVAHGTDEFVNLRTPIIEIELLESLAVPIAGQNTPVGVE